MENKITNESPIEELIENVDISRCISENNESIILTKLLTQINLNYNIPTDSNFVAILDR